MTAAVVFAHGSSVDAANEAIREIAARLQDASGVVAEAAFLELAHPDLTEITAALVERGATRIVVLPYFLAPGVHLQRDLPRIMDELSRIHTGVRIMAAPGLDGHPGLLNILLDRLRDAEAKL